MVAVIRREGRLDATGAGRHNDRGDTRRRKRRGGRHGRRDGDEGDDEGDGGRNGRLGQGEESAHGRSPFFLGRGFRTWRMCSQSM
ncbi:MAG: hypothetical protein WAU02_01295 [Candidatus Saccharimonadales bacterium]